MNQALANGPDCVVRVRATWAYNALLADLTPARQAGGKSPDCRLLGQVAADVRGGAARRWDSFRVGDRSSRIWCAPLAHPGPFRPIFLGLDMIASGLGIQLEYAA